MGRSFAVPVLSVALCLEAVESDCVCVASGNAPGAEACMFSGHSHDEDIPEYPKDIAIGLGNEMIQSCKVSGVLGKLCSLPAQRVTLQATGGQIRDRNLFVLCIIAFR